LSSRLQAIVGGGSFSNSSSQYKTVDLALPPSKLKGISLWGWGNEVLFLGRPETKGVGIGTQ